MAATTAGKRNTHHINKDEHALMIKTISEIVQ